MVVVVNHINQLLTLVNVVLLLLVVVNHINQLLTLVNLVESETVINHVPLTSWSYPVCMTVTISHHRFIVQVCG